jgi:hypothetical protein
LTLKKRKEKKNPLPYISQRQKPKREKKKPREKQ